MSQNPDAIFIEKLLEESGLTGLPTEYKERYTAELQNQLDERIAVIIMQNLNDDDAKRFADMLETSPAPTIEQMQDYFSKKFLAWTLR